MSDEPGEGSELGDDGAIHAFYAWLERRRGPLPDLERVGELREAVEEFDEEQVG